MLSPLQFFYERWGDAPVHSIAATLFLDRSRIHVSTSPSLPRANVALTLSPLSPQHFNDIG